MISLRTATVLGAVVATSVFAQQYPYPNVWPNQHHHTEIMYVPGLETVHIKPVFYDFTNLHYRADVFLMNGSFPNPLSPINQSSYWLADNLYIYDYWPITSCVSLNLGFGMMLPGWFLGGTQNGTVWFTKKYEYSSGDGGMYVNTLWMQSPVEGQGNFDYFSYLNDTLAGGVAGDPHHFSAPSPLGLVVNEYNNFTVANFSVSDPTFILPPGISCVNTSITDPFDAVSKHAPHLLPEIVMAARSRGLI